MRAYIVMHGYDHEGLTETGQPFEVYLSREDAERVAESSKGNDYRWQDYSSVIELSLPSLSRMQRWMASQEFVAGMRREGTGEVRRAEVVKQGTGW